MNTAFLSLYNIENLAPEIGERIHLKFTGTPFVETEPEFSILVPSGGEYEFSRNIYAFDVEVFPSNVEFTISLSTQTLTPFNVACIASYEGDDDTTMVVEGIIPGYNPSSKVRLHFRKRSRQKFVYRDFYSELFVISDCFRKLLMWESTLSEEPNAYPLFNILKSSLQDLYAKLNALYYGPDMVQHEMIQYEWSRIPHLYYDFYVYKYSTSFAAAQYFARKIYDGDTVIREKYLNFLKLFPRLEC